MLREQIIYFKNISSIHCHLIAKVLNMCIINKFNDVCVIKTTIIY